MLALLARRRHSSLQRTAQRLLSLLAVLFGLSSVDSLSAGKLELSESDTSEQTYSCEATVTSKGEVYFTKSTAQQDRAPLTAAATFRFSERRLPPAGREALALRAVREFQSAEMATTVGDHKTAVQLPANARLIISEGFREGVRHYSPSVKLNRDSIDLLELPGDPLVLIALLPLQTVEVDETWEPSDWVIQMLTGIEAVESSKLVCKLTAANTVSAKVTFTGTIKGQRYGADTEVGVRGTLIFDLRTSHIARTQAIYTIKADIGTVYPGLDIEVSSNLVRNVVERNPRFTKEMLDSIPLDPDPSALELTFQAEPWGVRLEHGRAWHLFRAVYDNANPVAIFRLVEHGSLVCQCNFSQLLKAAPGQMIPIAEFEADIQQALGASFKNIKEKKEIPTADGRRIIRVVVEGEQEVKGAKGAALIPMNWIYYLVAESSGRQLSFVFAVETPLLEQLNGRDLELVKSQRFDSR